jgi:hypothetical protein
VVFLNLSILLGFFIADNWQSCFDFEWNFPPSSQHLNSTFQNQINCKNREYVSKTPYSQRKIRAFKILLSIFPSFISKNGTVFIEKHVPLVILKTKFKQLGVVSKAFVMMIHCRLAI